MLRTRVIGLLMIICVAPLAWHLVHGTPAAKPTATAASAGQPPPSPGFTITPTDDPATDDTATDDTATDDTATDDPATDGSPTTTSTPLAVTPQPPDTTPVQADVSQDGGTDHTSTPGPDQRQVEAEEPPADRLTHAQLQTALERRTAGQARLRPELEEAAAAAAWQHVLPRLEAARTWSHLEQRAAVALLIGQHADPAQPVPVKVVITWTGTDPDGSTSIHSAETKLLYTDRTWQPVN